MDTLTAPVGQSCSQGMQYQHSSNCIYALPFVMSIASRSSGHTSTHTVQPFSAMHLLSSILTRAELRWRISCGVKAVGGDVSGVEDMVMLRQAVAASSAGSPIRRLR